MPILEIDLVGEVGTADAAGLAQRLADAAGAVFGSAPQSTWVKIRILGPADYAENGGAASPQRPVFVKVLKRSTSEGTEMADEVRRLTAAVAEVCSRPSESVHVCYEPPAQGRQAFGGELV